MRELWYQAVLWVLIRLYYRRIEVVGTVVDATVPVLYIGLHRNGAIDGMIYKQVAPNATFLISEQLTRSWFGRLFFTGIEVSRDKDVRRETGGAAGEGPSTAPKAARTRNADSLDRSVAHLIGGGTLFILPEGTSDLGPQHLPFKSGVAVILDRALAAGAPVRVVPTGIFYACPEGFRSDVTVVVGGDISTDGIADLDRQARPRELMSRMTAALEAIGVNVDTAGELDRVETMAAMAADSGARYYDRLKALERTPVPEHIGDEWRSVSKAVDAGELSTEHGTPVLSRRGVIWNAVWLCIQAPIVAAGAIVNLPVLVGAWLAARRMADARNTIALWRILAGAPLALAWILAVVVVACVLDRPELVFVWLIMTAGGLWLYPEFRARWPRFRNALRPDRHRHAFESIIAWVDSLVGEPAIHPSPAVVDVDWSSRGLMPHEIGFAALCLVAMARLSVSTGGATLSLLASWIAILVAIAVCVWLTRRWPGPTTWRIRLGAYLLIMNAAYLLLGPTVRGAGAPLRDAALQHVDSTLFGQPVPLYLDAMTSPALSDLLSACYLFLFPYIVFSVLRHLRRVPESLDVAKRFHIGLFTVYAVGFLGYLFVPAQGAYLAMPDAFRHPIAGGATTRLNDSIVRRGSIGVDVFPSIHVAVSTFILLFDRRYARWRHYAYLGPAIGLWIATLYLRYHYGVDVMAGFALALLVVWLATRDWPLFSPMRRS